MNTETMKTYVAEINGEATMAFRAVDAYHAHDLINDVYGPMQLGLSGCSGPEREDGRPLWDEETPIELRVATEEEHECWCKARDAEIRKAADGKQINPEMGDAVDDFNVYLVPTKPVNKGDVAAA
jgi:hypothetical protein